MTDKKLKFLFVDFALPNLLKDNEFPAGGAAMELLSWIEGINLIGHKVGVLTWKGAKKFINKDLDFDIVESFEQKKGIPFLRLFYYWLPNVLSAIKNYNPDIIIQMGSGRLTFISAYASKKLKKTFVYRVVSDKDVDERIKKKLHKRDLFLYRSALKNTNIFVCQNNYQYENMKEKFPKKKCCILYPPFEISKDLAPLKGKEKSFIAFMGGGFRYEKNIVELENVAKFLPDVKFKITGKPSINTDKLSMNAIEKLKTLNNVEFVGYIKRTEIYSFLSQAFALLNTSVLEGFPTNFLEAWSIGIPVITTKNVNPDSIITNKQLGMVTDSYDDLPLTIQKLIDSEPNEELRKRCSEYVKNYHNPETLARKLIEAIV